MKIGVSYPSTDAAGDHAAIRGFVAAIEELGFDHMMAPDHVIKCPHEGREPKLMGPYTEDHPFHDPVVLFAFASAISATLEFATGVLILPQRQTALVAQQAADVDFISCERLRLCVGIGWNHVEFAALGQDFRTRGKRIEEQITLLRALWGKPLVTFEGRFDRIDRACINPRPRRQIPLWLGGYTEPAYARAARLADGFLFASTGRERSRLGIGSGTTSNCVGVQNGHSAGICWRSSRPERRKLQTISNNGAAPAAHMVHSRRPIKGSAGTSMLKSLTRQGLSG